MIGLKEMEAPDLKQQSLGKTPKSEKVSFLVGVGLTLGIAVIAKLVAYLPILSVVGPLVIAIVFGMVWKATIRYPVHLTAGITFSSKKILRLGIILLGMQLDFKSIVDAGLSVIITATIVITFTILTTTWIGKKMKLDPNISLLTACGTGICGAAAIVAIAPQLKARDDQVAVSVATIAMLGTLITFVYVFVYPFIDVSNYAYGFFAGATLHELAHVIAAADQGGASSLDIAVIMKLTRVVLLVPVAMIIGFIFLRKNPSDDKAEFSWKTLPIPWFIVGFLAMSAINTLNILPSIVSNIVIGIAYLLIGMAMAALGLNVDFKTFQESGFKSFTAGLIGTILLIVVGLGLVVLFV